MLEAGVPAVEVMTEYVQACRLLGHTVPEPATLHAAYTAEDGLDLQALEADHRALCQTAAAVEDALLLQEQARRALTAAWRGAGAQAAADHLAHHAAASGDAAERLRTAAAALGELRDRLWQLIDAKVGAVQDIEARGMRAEWLNASRTVTTGAGDRSAASELVDLQVAPFVANDVALDCVAAMRDTESAVRQAYRDAAAAIEAHGAAVFERSGPSGAVPVVAESVSDRSSGPAAPVSVAPAGFLPGPAPADVPPAQIPAAPPVVAPPAADPMAGAPMSAAASPLGSGMSGMSGLGQSFADMLGGLLGSGGGGLGESLRAGDDLDTLTDDLSEDDEPDDPTERDPDEEDPDEEDPDEEDEDPDGDEPLEDAAATEEPVEPDAAEPVAPDAVTPELPAPTPVPEPPIDPSVAPVEPAPTDTPCAIAADELPQAGP